MTFNDDVLGPRLNLNNTIQNKRGKLPIDVAERMFWIGNAMGVQAMENLRMKHTPKEQMTRNFITGEINRVLTEEYGMPPMNEHETMLFVFVMTKHIETEKRKKAMRMDAFMKDTIKRFENK